MKNNGGYTLIEILVSLTLISVIFGVGYIAFREFSRRQLINSAARTILGDLRLAQAEAIDGAKPSHTNCTNPKVLDGYYFEVMPPNSYKIEAKCSGGTVLIKSVTLADAVSLQSPTVNPIFFKSLGHGSNISEGQTVAIVINALGLIGTVQISSGGIIE